MPSIRKKHITTHYRGAIGKTIVVKQYNGKTVITAYPDMSKIVPSAKQQASKAAFAEAVAYARNINNDPVKRASYAATLPKGRSVYHAAISANLLYLKSKG